jgi:TonB family protein
MVQVSLTRTRALFVSSVMLGLVASGVRAQPAAEAPAASAVPDALTAPTVLESPAPQYPESELRSANEQTVIMHVTVAIDGTVSDAHVDHAVSPAFDQAALDVIKRWKFTPAKRGDAPIPAAVRVAVRFTPPDFDLSDHGPVLDPHAAPPVAAPPPAAQPPAAPVPVPALAAEPTPPAAEQRTALSASAKVRATTLRPEARSSSDFVIEREVLQAAPHRDTTALLVTAPGVYVARSEGDAVAPHVTLRGFDAEHGQDIAFSAGGIPVNLPSHVHGQGYADLNFIPPEVVRYVRVTEGVYDPNQGDFAVAGSVDFELGVPERGLTSRTSYGSFDTLRQLLLWAPEGEPVESFAAASFGRTDGFGPRREGESAGVIAQHVMESGRWRGRVLGSFYGARSQLPGSLRLDDVERGAVDFYGAYDDPVAQSQAASTTEGKLGAFAEHHADDGSTSQLGAWLALHAFRAQEAFTGYLERSELNPEWINRGDLIEQQNQVTALGLSASHRTRSYELSSWAQAALRGGLTGRIDRIEQSKNMLEPPDNAVWDRRIDAEIDASDIGAFVDVELSMIERLTLHAGARANALHYTVDDRLANLDDDDALAGARRTASGFVAGPRTSAQLAITPWLTAFAAYGQGYRSPQARQIEDGKRIPFTKVHSGDVGLRVELAPEQRAVITASGFYTALSDDVAFHPEEGEFEPIGPTTRTGVTAHAIVQPWSFFVASASLTYVRAELDGEPQEHEEEHAHGESELVPYVPPLVLRLDASIEHALTKIEGAPLGGRVGLGFTHLGPRPLPFDADSDAVSLFDAAASLRYRAVELGIDVFNLFDSEHIATEHVFASNWDADDTTPSLDPVRHIAAGPPRTVLVTLGLHL